jgi:hypothetical protein
LKSILLLLGLSASNPPTQHSAVYKNVPNKATLRKFLLLIYQFGHLGFSLVETVFRSLDKSNNHLTSDKSSSSSCNTPKQSSRRKKELRRDFKSLTVNKEDERWLLDLG